MREQKFIDGTIIEDYYQTTLCSPDMEDTLSNGIDSFMTRCNYVCREFTKRDSSHRIYFTVLSGSDKPGPRTGIISIHQFINVFCQTSDGLPKIDICVSALNVEAGKLEYAWIRIEIPDTCVEFKFDIHNGFAWAALRNPDDVLTNPIKLTIAESIDTIPSLDTYKTSSPLDLHGAENRKLEMRDIWFTAPF